MHHFTAIAKYCALVHLGYIPAKRHDGLCPNIRALLETLGASDVRVETTDMRIKDYLAEHYGEALFPIEGSQLAYIRNKDKYTGGFGRDRRVLALKLAVYFNSLRGVE